MLLDRRGVQLLFDPPPPLLIPLFDIDHVCPYRRCSGVGNQGAACIDRTDPGSPSRWGNKSRVCQSGHVDVFIFETDYISCNTPLQQPQSDPSRSMQCRYLYTMLSASLCSLHLHAKIDPTTIEFRLFHTQEGISLIHRLSFTKTLSTFPSFVAESFLHQCQHPAE